MPAPPRQSTRIVNEKIRLLRRISKSIENAEAISGHIREMLVGYRHLAARLRPGMTFYRARKVTLDEVPTHIEGISYPKLAPHIGRANRHGLPIFYAAFSPTCALTEVRAVPGDHIVLSSWNNSHELIISGAGYTLSTFVALGARRNIASTAMFNSSPSPDRPVDTKIYNFIADHITKKAETDEEYILSACISEILMGPIGDISRFFGMSHHPPRIGAMIYPSLMRTADEDNIAISAEVADSLLRPYEAVLVRVDGENEERYDIARIAFVDRFAPNRELHWTYNDQV